MDENQVPQENENVNPAPEAPQYQPPQYQQQYQPPYQSAQYQNYQQNYTEPKNSGKAVASLVLGIISIVLCASSVLTIITGIIGLIFGIKEASGNNKGMAIGGIVTSSIGILRSLIWTVVYIAAIIAAVALVQNGDVNSFGNFNY